MLMLFASGNTHCKSVPTLRPRKADGSSAFLFSLAGDRFMNPTQAQGIGNIIRLDAPQPNLLDGVALFFAAQTLSALPLCQVVLVRKSSFSIVLGERPSSRRSWAHPIPPRPLGQQDCSSCPARSRPSRPPSHFLHLGDLSSRPCCRGPCAPRSLSTSKTS